MKPIRWILVLCLNLIASFIVTCAVTFGIAYTLDLLYPNITDAELVTKENLGRAYFIGIAAGATILMILSPIINKIYSYVRNWKKKERTVRLTFSDGGVTKESLLIFGKKEELD